MQSKGLIGLLLIVFAVSAEGRQFHVSVDDGSASDGNPGTSAAPFKTIAHASQILAPGDTCLIHSGVYRETIRPVASGNGQSQITYAANPGALVLVTGLDPVTSWSTLSAGIYSTNFPPAVIHSQMFLDSVPLPEPMFPAQQWPSDGNPLNLRMANVESSWRVGTSNDFCVRNHGLASVDKSTWVGTAKVWGLWGDKEIGRPLNVKSVGSDYVCFDFSMWAGVGDYLPTRAWSDSVDIPQFAVYAPSGSLDADFVWKNVITPGGMEPMTSIQIRLPQDPSTLSLSARTRQFGADLSQRSYVRIQGIHFLAAGGNLEGANHCVVSGCDFKYPSTFGLPPDQTFSSLDHMPLELYGLVIIGDSNQIDHCRIEHAWNTGIHVAGDGNSVTWNTVIDVDALAGEFAGIAVAPLPGRTSDSHANRILYNTITSCGRSGIILTNSRTAEIAYNRIEAVGRIAHDLGGIYTFQNDGLGTRIHHNTVIMDNGSNQSHGLVGIYIDERSPNHVIYDNVISGIVSPFYTLKINRPGWNDSIFNNTSWNGWGLYSRPLTETCPVDPSDHTYCLSGIRFANNLFFGGKPGKSAPDDWSDHVTWDASNVELFTTSSGGFLSAASQDMRLNGSVTAWINTAEAIDGIGQGANRDLGAYPLGDNWTSGTGNSALSKSIAGPWKVYLGLPYKYVASAPVADEDILNLLW